MKVEPGALPGLVVLSPSIFRDHRGSFRETWHERRYADAGLPGFVQDNLAVSRRGVVRGLHFQAPRGQGKLISVAAGEILDVAVDVRAGSPTFGRWARYRLTEQEGTQLYIPPGFAHGYAVLSEQAIVTYRCTDFYDPPSERTLLWNDPAIGIDWPFAEPELSEKDRRGRPLAELPPDQLPTFAG